MNVLTSHFMSDIFLGVTNGVLYGLIALSLVIVWRATSILNFAQGAMAMFATYLGMTMTEHGLNFWLAFALAIVAGFAMGGVTERVLVRPLYRRPEINSIVVMVGFLGVLESAAAAIWSSSPRVLESPFSQNYFQHGNTTIDLSPFALFQIGAAMAVMLCVGAIFQYTKLGLQLRASALAPEVARLLGVRVNRLLTFGWMLSSAAGVVAAVIITSSSSIFLTPSVMDGFFVFGFIAAAVGGLESPVGAIVSGLLIGLAQQFLLDYAPSGLSSFAPVVILVVALMIRPQGLFTTTKARRV